MPSIQYILELGTDVLPSVQQGFGSLQSQLQDTQGEIAQTSREQRRLNRRLKQVEVGSDEYRELERELADVNAKAQALNSTLQRQERHLRNINRTAKASAVAFGAGTAALAGFGAEVFYTANKMGEFSQELLTAHRATGIAVEDLQRLQLGVAATGRELDLYGLGEVVLRIGESVKDAAGPLHDFFDSIGIDARNISSQDIPHLIRSIQELDNIDVRRFGFDELFGGTEGEMLADLFNLPPETLARIDELTVLSQEQAEQFVQTKGRLSALNQEFAMGRAELAQGFLPVMEEFAETLTPLMTDMGEWIGNNQELVKTLLVLGAAATGIVGAIWLVTKAIAAYNAAKSIALALAGPPGWIALGVAAGVTAGAFALTAGVSNRADEAEEEQKAINESLLDLRHEEADRAVPKVDQVEDKKVAKEIRGNEEKLQNILAVTDCRITDIEDRLDGKDKKPGLSAGMIDFIPVTEPPAEAYSAGMLDDFAYGGVLQERATANIRAGRQSVEEAIELATPTTKALIEEEGIDLNDMTPRERAEFEERLEWRTRIEQGRGDRVSVVDHPGELPVAAPVDRPEPQIAHYSGSGRVIDDAPMPTSAVLEPPHIATPAPMLTTNNDNSRSVVMEPGAVQINEARNTAAVANAVDRGIRRAANEGGTL